MRIVDLQGSPETMGRTHGVKFGSSIQRYLDDRVSTLSGDEWPCADEVRAVMIQAAGASIESHAAYSESLFDELAAMASAAQIGIEDALVVGGFTDVVDIARSTLATSPVIHECTGILNPAKGYLAQTWDMNMSAGEFVIMVRIEPLSGPNSIVQTTMGCLGQIGLNEAGIAVGISNLSSMGRPGVTWPFVVRKVLQQSTLDAAVTAVLDADLAGGHNFFLMGPDGDAVNIEAMPNAVSVQRSEAAPLVHSNHCLSAETAAGEVEVGFELSEDSNLRLEIARESADDLERFFSDPRISRLGIEAHDGATCGAVVMKPGAREVQAVWGSPNEHPWETFTF